MRCLLTQPASKPPYRIIVSFAMMCPGNRVLPSVLLLLAMIFKRCIADDECL